MKVFGLTGGIATGKSTVAKKLAELGATIIDADLIAHEVVEPGTPTLAKVVEAFGADILLNDGSLNRDKLGSIVFGDAEKRTLLGRITHPAIGQEMMKQLNDCRQRGEKVVIMDIPLLLDKPGESMKDSPYNWLDGGIVVTADRDTQHYRLMQRDGVSSDEASERMAAQRPVAEKAEYATLVIDNSGSIADTTIRVEKLWAKLNGN